MALLEIKNIKKSFDENLILNDVSLNVEQGEVIVILGPSGCGKSTLLRCINGLETIQDGKILLDGEVISNRKKDMHLIRQKALLPGACKAYGQLQRVVFDRRKAVADKQIFYLKALHAQATCLLLFLILQCRVLIHVRVLVQEEYFL